MRVLESNLEQRMKKYAKKNSRKKIWLKILSALSISPMCVTDLSRILKLNQTTVSHQLRTLRNGGAVKGIRQGKITFYRVKSQEISDFLLKGLEQFT